MLSSAGHGALCMFSCCPESPYHIQCLSRVAVTVLGQGPQSWLFCPIISLALAVVERAQGVTPFSTRPRSAVPPAQQQFWLTHAAAIVDSLASHFQSLSQSHVAQVLQSQSSWVGGEHLSGPQQELCVPPSVLDSLSTWLATQCEQFASGPQQGFCCRSSFAQPFVNMQVETVASPRSPFLNAVLSPVDTSGPGSPIVVSHPFVRMPVAGEPPPSQSASPFQFFEGGPVWLTRFVEVPLDVYARVNA